LLIVDGGFDVFLDLQVFYWVFFHQCS
jgi:hypothetical protein